MGSALVVGLGVLGHLVFGCHLYLILPLRAGVLVLRRLLFGWTLGVGPAPLARMTPRNENSLCFAMRRQPIEGLRPPKAVVAGNLQLLRWPRVTHGRPVLPRCLCLRLVLLLLILGKLHLLDLEGLGRLLLLLRARLLLWGLPCLDVVRQLVLDLYKRALQVVEVILMQLVLSARGGAVLPRDLAARDDSFACILKGVPPRVVYVLVLGGCPLLRGLVVVLEGAIA